LNKTNKRNPFVLIKNNIKKKIKMYGRNLKPKRSDRKKNNNYQNNVAPVLSQPQYQINPVPYFGHTNNVAQGEMYQKPAYNMPSTRKGRSKYTQRLNKNVVQPEQPSLYNQQPSDAYQENYQTVNNSDDYAFNETEPLSNFSKKASLNQMLTFSDLVFKIMQNKHHLNSNQSSLQQSKCPDDLEHDIIQKMKKHTILYNLHGLVENCVTHFNEKLSHQRNRNIMMGDVLKKTIALFGRNIMDNLINQKIRNYQEISKEYVELNTQMENKCRVYMNFVKDRINNDDASQINSLLDHFEKNKHYQTKIMDKVEPMIVQETIIYNELSRRMMGILDHIKGIFDSKRTSVPMDIQTQIDSVKDLSIAQAEFLLYYQFDYDQSNRNLLKTSLTEIYGELIKLFDMSKQTRASILEETNYVIKCHGGQPTNQMILNKMKQMCERQFSQPDKHISSRFDQITKVLTFTGTNDHPFDRNIGKITDKSLVEYENIGGDYFTKTWASINNRKHEVNENMNRLYYERLEMIVSEIYRLHDENKQFIDLMQQLTNE